MYQAARRALRDTEQRSSCDKSLLSHEINARGSLKINVNKLMGK